MALKRLLSEEMLALSAAWINPQSSAHQAILASSDLAPQLPKITAAHNDLASAAQPVPVNPRIAEISKEQASLDARHDDILRGIYWLLTGTIHLLGPQSDGIPLLQLRNALLPDGLPSLQKSYRAEAGQAQQLKERLTPELRAQTDKITVGPKNKSRTLTKLLEEWIELGNQIGSLEDEKGQLAVPLGESSANAVLLAARNKWIRAVNLFVALAESAELEAASHQLILGPLQLAESKADQRSSAPAPAPASSDA